ncbi:MAG: hypothetical protein IJ860_10480 [Eubacterium sp.]|nr:hypothetical protein [Eubacterium sp.]
MGLLEKMASFVKKQPTKAELERMDKKKIDGDRARMEDLRARVEAAGAFAPSAKMEPEDVEEIKRYFQAISGYMKNTSATAFDVTGVDKYMADIISVLERAMKESGSKKTIMRCFQGVSFAVLNARNPIPENAIEADLVKRREDFTSRYLQLAMLSLEKDQMLRDVDRKRDQKRQVELHFDEEDAKLDKMLDEHPGAREQLKKITPGSQDQLTGDMKLMASQMMLVVDLSKRKRQIDLLIGDEMERVSAVESAINDLILQQESWESSIDQQSLAEITRLNQEFKRRLLAEREQMERLRGVSDDFNLAIEAVLAEDPDARMRVAEAEIKYKKMMDEKKKQEEADRAARERQRQKQEEERQRILAEQESEGQILTNDGDLYS